MYAYAITVGNRIIIDTMLYLQGNFSSGRSTSSTYFSERLKGHEAHSDIIRIFASATRAYTYVLAFLEERQLGWLRDIAKAYGKRFVEGMSWAFFS